MDVQRAVVDTHNLENTAEVTNSNEEGASSNQALLGEAYLPSNSDSTCDSSSSAPTT
jgi:hypothetical protein